MKSSTYHRFDFEKIIEPRYHADSLFMPINALENLYPSINLKDIKPNSQDYHFYTLLNFDISTTKLPSHSTLVIPFYGLNKQTEFFYQDLVFDTIIEKLELIQQKDITISFIFEYQINLFTLSALRDFLNEFLVLKSKFSNLTINFKNTLRPSYLDCRLASPLHKDWIEESLYFLKQNYGTNSTEYIELELICNSISTSYIQNEPKEQLLASLYLNFFHGKKDPFNTSKAIELFPHCKSIIKESAKLFMDINPNHLIASSQKENINSDTNAVVISNNSHLEERFKKITSNIHCTHKDEELFYLYETLKSLNSDPESIILEAGVFKGGATAKLSIIAKEFNKMLYAFDSFCGLPEHSESASNKLYPKGAYYGSLKEVTKNLKKYGEIDSCTLVEGWFKNTLPKLDQKVAIAFLDVDLVESTKTCIVNLWPKLIPGGILFSHDGQFDEVQNLIHDKEFWEVTLKTKTPKITNPLNTNNFIKIEKI